MIRAVINGFGRIGRNSLRVWLNRPDLQKKIDIVALNTSGSLDTNGWAHLLKYDSSYRKIPQEVTIESVKSPQDVTDKDPLIGYFKILDRKIPVLAQRDPEKLPWKKYKVDIVIESTGVFRDEKGAGKRLNAGAKRVVLSAPSKGAGIPHFRSRVTARGLSSLMKFSVNFFTLLGHSL